MDRATKAFDPILSETRWPDVLHYQHYQHHHTKPLIIMSGINAMTDEKLAGSGTNRDWSDRWCIFKNKTLIDLCHYICNFFYLLLLEIKRRTEDKQKKKKLRQKLILLALGWLNDSSSKRTWNEKICIRWAHPRNHPKMKSLDNKDNTMV